MFAITKVVDGSLQGQMNLQDTTESILGIVLFNVDFVKELFQDLIILHCT
jgi:hypothetical protein